jgi:gliding motility-associated-like protein
MCKGTYLSFIFLLFLSLASNAQGSGSSSLNPGDSLLGFDRHACLQEASEDKLTPAETKAYIHNQEIQYIQAKYHLPTKHRHSPVSTISVQGLACNNIGFETGDYTNWTGYIGYNANSGAAVTQLSAGIIPNTLGLDSPEPGCSMFTLVDAAAGNDPYGAFPMLDPLPAGGSYSVRLGGENANLQSGSSCTNNSPGGAPGESMSQTFVVTTANAMFIYNYAVVLVQAPHTAAQCPYFRAEVLDSTGTPIPCLQYYVESVGTGTPPGMSVSAVTSSKGSPVYYMPWTSNSLNLKNYIGHPVTIRFSAAGCTPGGHWGYAYVDATCSPVQVIASSPEVCMGGTLTLTAPSAGPTGTYAWNTMPSGTAGIVGSTTGASVTVNANGTYQVTVTQAPGCTYVIDTTIAFYPNPVLTLTSTNPTCNPGHNGTATATVTGGNTPITYVWSPAPSGGQGTANATGLDPGTYNLTVTTVNGCTTSGSVTLTGAAPGPTVTLTSTPASCSPGGDGTATATVTGGTGPFTYTWTPAPAGGQGTTNATGLNGGTYTFVVNGPVGTCSDSATVVVTQPNGPTATSSTTNVSCFGLSDGTATINATGGTAPFTYVWIGNPSTTNVATGLAIGTYTCTTTDSKGCSVQTLVTITQPAVLTITASGVPATCNGKCNGQLIGLPGGGTASYSYSWSNGNTTPSSNNVCAGTYTLTLTDAHGCVATDTALVTQPTALVMNMFPTPSHCAKPDGKDSVTVTGGTPGYTYTWSNAQTTQGIHGILAGNYTVIIKDQNGCPDTMSNNVPNLPGVNLINVASTPVSCFGGNNGTARDSAYGGFKPYTFNWTPAPGGGQGTASVTGLPAGTYVCTVTDSAHCTNQVSVTIIQPPQLLLTSGNQKICIGQCATLSASANGGSAPYSYSWTQNGTPLVSAVVCPVVTTTYTATVTDSHGCVAAPALDTVIVNPPLEVVASGGKSICPGGIDTLHATGSGGNGGPYTYTWIPTTGLTNPNSQNPIATPTVTTIYTVIVADNCGTPTDSAMTTVTVYPLPLITLTSIDTIVCAPACVTFVGTSNPACASGSWLFGDGQTATGCDSAHHCYPVAGTYNVTYNVTDIHGCKGSISKPNFINAMPVPHASFTDSPQPTDITNPTIGFNNTSTNAVSWLWTFGDGTDSAAITLNAVHTYLDTGCYTAKLVVTASDGCKDSTTGPICIAPIFAFYAPNTFTPNGDGKNDEWMPFGVGIDPNNYDLMMFDRWGNLMFETHTWGQGWDGRANHGANIAQIDTYVWKVNLKDIFGIRHSYMGHANLIR